MLSHRQSDSSILIILSCEMLKGGNTGLNEVLQIYSLQGGSEPLI